MALGYALRTMDTNEMTLVDLREAIVSRAVSAEEAARSALGRIAAVDPGIHAFLEVFEVEALAQARESDRRLAGGGGEPARLLEGVPVALKDNICLGYGRTTCASRMLENYRSPFTATAAAALLEAGAVIIGKTNLDEFAMGSSCEHSAFGPTRNPWDLTRVSGGSSGGSAAAVAARMCAAALGSDTGGSIRQPAGWCGVVGVKPTYGRVSRYGLVAFASSLDQIGCFARTVGDAAAVLSVICGHDERDSTSLDLPRPNFCFGLEEAVAGGGGGVRLGVVRGGEGNHPAVDEAMMRAIEVYRSLGAEIVEVELPHAAYGIAAYYILAPAEASSNLARFDGVRYGRRAAPPHGRDDGLEELYARSRAEGFGEEVKRRIMLGTHALSSGYAEAYYQSALKVRRLIKGDFDAVFGEGKCQAILMPSSPGPAYRIGEKADDPLAEYLEDVYTVGVNLAGLPGVTIPGGFARVEGGVELPVGVQLIGPALSEGVLLRIARMHEREVGLFRRGPGGK